MADNPAPPPRPRPVLAAASVLLTTPLVLWWLASETLYGFDRPHPVTGWDAGDGVWHGAVAVLLFPVGLGLAPASRSGRPAAVWLLYLAAIAARALTR